jgi:hypothetical protein
MSKKQTPKIPNSKKSFFSLKTFINFRTENANNIGIVFHPGFFSAAKKDFVGAGSILIAKPRTGADKCEAARGAFAEELQQERGAR